MSTDPTTFRRGAFILGAVMLGGYLTDYAFNLGLARFLEPHAYGDFKVAHSFGFLFGLAVLLGGDRAAPMVLAPCLERLEPSKVWEYLRFYLRNAMLLALLVIAVTWTVSYLHIGSSDTRHHHPLAWVVLAIPMNAAAAMISRTMQSARRPAEAVLPWRIGLPLLQLALFGLVIGLHGTLSVEEAVVIAIVATAIITLVQWFRVRSLGLVEVSRDPTFLEPRAWLGASLPMMGSFLVALALNQSDIYFLEGLGDEHEVGFYAAAATAAHLLLLVQTTLVGFVAPLAKPAIEAGADSSRLMFRKAQKLLIAMLIPVAALLALGADPILAFFGPNYRAAAPVLEWLVLGGVAWAAASISVLWLQYQGRAGVVLMISLATLGLDSGLNLVLIPRYGMTGAAAGTAATLCLASLAVVVAERRVSRAAAPPSTGAPQAT